MNERNHLEGHQAGEGITQGATMQKKQFILSLLLISNIVTAQTIYQWTDEQGNTVFSDKPQPGAQEKTVPELPSYHAPKIPATTPQTQQPTPPQTIYQSLSITSPKNQETIWSNQGIIPVSVDLQPALAKGDTLIITVDGKNVLESTSSTTLQLKSIDRGTHSIQAKVIDKNGKTAKTSLAVTVYLHKASVNQMKQTVPVVTSGPSP